MKRMVPPRLVAAVGGLAAAVGYRSGTAGDLILTNGKIVTVESAGGQAQAIAVRGDRIVALGSSAQIKRHTGPSTQVIDLQEAGHPWIRRRARTLHWRRRDPAQSESDEGDELGRDRRDGCGGGQEGEAGGVDPRARLASGEMDEEARSGRRGIPDPPLVERRVAIILST